MRTATATIAALALTGVACSSSNSPAPQEKAVCTATFAGNVDETATTTTACATLAAGSAGSGDEELDIDLTAPVSGIELQVAIDLGAAPSATSYTSETVTSWYALGARTVYGTGSDNIGSDAGSADVPGMCTYSAGGQAVPTGSFTLDLSAVGGGSAGVHGTFSVMQYVQAEPTFDCGSGDDETVDITF